MARPRSVIDAGTEILAPGVRVVLDYTNAHAID
jgi:hypothetical protein